MAPPKSQLPQTLNNQDRKKDTSSRSHTSISTLQTTFSSNTLVNDSSNIHLPFMPPTPTPAPRPLPAGNAARHDGAAKSGDANDRHLDRPGGPLDPARVQGSRRARIGCHDGLAVGSGVVDRRHSLSLSMANRPSDRQFGGLRKQPKAGNGDVGVVRNRPAGGGDTDNERIAREKEEAEAEAKRKRYSDVITFPPPRTKSIQGLVDYSSSPVASVREGDNDGDGDTADTPPVPPIPREFRGKAAKSAWADESVEDDTQAAKGASGSTDEHVENSDELTALPTVFMTDVYRPEIKGGPIDRRIRKATSSEHLLKQSSRSRRHRRRSSRSGNTGDTGWNDYAGVVIRPSIKKRVGEEPKPGIEQESVSGNVQHRTRQVASACVESQTTEKDNKGTAQKHRWFPETLLCCPTSKANHHSSRWPARSEKKQAPRISEPVAIVKLPAKMHEHSVTVDEDPVDVAGGNDDRDEEREISLADMLASTPPDSTATIPMVPYIDVSRFGNKTGLLRKPKQPKTASG